MSAFQERRPYRCPGCGQVFRIPATAPDPGLCPACQSAAVPPAPVPPARVEPPPLSPPPEATAAPAVIPLPDWMHYLPWASLTVGAVVSLLFSAFPLVIAVAGGAAAAVLGGLSLAIPPLCVGKKKAAAVFGILLGTGAITFGGITLFFMQTASDTGAAFGPLLDIMRKASEALN